jgi:hypothetical protein
MSAIITAKILNEFATSELFRAISTYQSAPDFLLTGRVDRFFEHNRRKLWTYVPYYSDTLARLFRLNTYIRTGEVHLTMILLKPSGELLHTYTGHVTFDEDFTPNDDVQPGDRLNRAFSQVMTHIRDAMLTDTTLPKACHTEPLARGTGR